MKLSAGPMLSAAIGLSGAVLVGMGLTPPVRQACAAEQVSFAQDILPLLQWRCVSCHQPPDGEGYKKSGVDLTSYEGLMKGSRFGPMVIPGDPESSNLMMLLDWRVAPEIRMPHGKKKLSTCDRDAIRHWIAQGAKDN